MNKTKPKKGLFKIPIDVFDFDLYIVFCKQEVFNKFLTKISNKFRELGEEEIQGVCCTYHGRKICIGIFDQSHDKKATLIHELSHAVDWILEYLNIPSTRENTETRSNLMEYLYKKALSYKLL